MWREGRILLCLIPLISEYFGNHTLLKNIPRLTLGNSARLGKSLLICLGVISNKRHPNYDPKEGIIFSFVACRWSLGEH